MPKSEQVCAEYLPGSSSGRPTQTFQSQETVSDTRSRKERKICFLRSVATRDGCFTAGRQGFRAQITQLVRLGGGPGWGMDSMMARTVCRIEKVLGWDAESKIKRKRAQSRASHADQPYFTGR